MRRAAPTLPLTCAFCGSTSHVIWSHFLQADACERCWARRGGLALVVRQIRKKVFEPSFEDPSEGRAVRRGEARKVEEEEPWMS